MHSITVLIMIIKKLIYTIFHRKKKKEKIVPTIIQSDEKVNMVNATLVRMCNKQ